MNTQEYILPEGTILRGNTYRIIEKIGEGGFGITYLAEQILLEYKVVIKELFITGNCVRQRGNTVSIQSISTNQYIDFKKRFFEEGRTLARLKHKNIVKVSDIFEENNTVYLVMDYIEGGTLKEKVKKEGILQESTALKYIRQASEALAMVHNRGFLHRDIKPSNIMLSASDDAILIDFGIAKEYLREGTQSNTGSHTPGYAPIEQYSLNTKLGPYTDIYALGATLYFCLTGKKPSDAVERYDTRLVPPKQLNPYISDGINNAIMKAMQLRKDDRYQSIGQFLNGLVVRRSSSNPSIRISPPFKPKPPTDETVFGNAEPVLPRTTPPRSYSSSAVPKPKSNNKGYVYGWLLFVFSILVMVGLIAQASSSYPEDYSSLTVVGGFFLILSIVIGRKRRAILKGIETFLYWMTGCMGYLMIFVGLMAGDNGDSDGVVEAPLLFIPPLLVGLYLNYRTKKAGYYAPFLFIAFIGSITFGAIYSDIMRDQSESSQGFIWLCSIGYFILCIFTPLWWENKFKDLKA